MKKDLLLVASLLSLSLSAQANEWEFLPIMGNNYQADFSVAIDGGRIDIDNDNDTDRDDFSTTGIEVALNCPLLKPPNHMIRQQISYAVSDENDVETKYFELNPHHMFAINHKLQAGIGPSLGYTKVETNAGDDNVFTYGLGASLRYNVNPNIFLGAEVRYVKSKEVEIAGFDEEYDNFRMLFKAGYQF